MDRERRTRQSNREYQQRIRRERYQEEQRETGYFSVIPKSPEEKQKAAQAEEKRQSHRRSHGSKNTDSKRKHASVKSSHKKMRQNASEQKERNRKEARDVKRQQRRASEDSRKKVRRPSEDMRQQQTAAAREQQRRALRNPVYFDYTLVFIVVFLVMFGLLMLYTASIYTTKYFIKQCVISLGAMVVLYIFSRIDYHVYAKKWMPLIITIGSVGSIGLLLTPLGRNVNGSTRWIGIGPISVQPAEICKIAIIVLNAVLITKLSRKMQERNVIGLFAFIAIVSFLLILIPADNLSSAIIVALITVFMVFVAYPTYKPFLILGGLGLAGAGLLIYLCLTVEDFLGFRGQRIIAWLQPEKIADTDLIFQSTQALYSIGSGGPWGKGLGSGTQKMILPEAMNDMIFAIICEELGMVGAFIVLVLFAFLLYRIMFIAKNSKDLLGGMLATGVFVHFMVQVILNIGVVTGLLPPTGVTLPFISHGGTATVLLMAEVGIVLNVSRQIDFEHRVEKEYVPKKKRHR